MKNILAKYWYIALCVVSVAVLGVVFLWSGRATPAVPVAEPRDTPTRYIRVHIVGEVVAPGVYTVPQGARITDVLELAGGPTPYANVHSPLLNLSAVVTDGQQINVPRLPGLDGAEGTYGNEGTGGILAVPQGICPKTGRVNINFANSAELQTLPGIGNVIAQNVITHRENHGPFTSVEQLVNVPRIGTVTMNNLRDLVTVG